MNNVYEGEYFFDEYAQISRSQQGLSGAGEWHQFKSLFPELSGKSVLDLGCGSAGTANMRWRAVQNRCWAST